jgi:alpha-beta hydrolase superfamily lysophospholipase
MIRIGLLCNTPRCFQSVLWLVGAALLTQCASREILVKHTDAAKIARKNETFGYRKWVSKETKPDVVIIGLHGFDGASIDYENLGKDLLKNHPRVGLYAYELRGQGSDPKRDRRGDISRPSDWYRDLDVFTTMIRQRHPGAKIVWMGESMGALILSHSWRQAPAGTNPCDAIILSSPVVKIRDDIPSWKVAMLHLASVAAPKARFSLEQLSGGQDVQMTHNTKHTEQAETNSWHVETNTLRLLSALGLHIQDMDDCAATFRVPVLILHGSKDYFTNGEAIEEFTRSIPPEVPVTTKIYPDAYHLLMYDRDKDKVIRDIGRWVDALK